LNSDALEIPHPADCFSDVRVEGDNVEVDLEARVMRMWTRIV
jgi:hypothetical protein